MARFKDFDAAEAERKGEPITFALGGREWTAAHVNAANFLAFTRAIAAGGNDVVIGFDAFITQSLEEGERKDFHRMLAEKDISLPTLMELGQWIIEQASGNPTPAASSSPAPPSKNGRPLRVYSLDPVSTPEAIPSAAG